MERESLTTWLPQLLRDNLLTIPLGCISLLLLGYGMMLFYSSSTASEDTIIDTQAEEVNTESMIMVDVSGAVEKSGVYELSFDSRMSGAIQRQGG